MYNREYLDDREMGLGDLRFPRPLTVSEINEFIKQLFDGIPQFRELSIEGEISNFKNHYSTGHIYFTLKDDSSAIRAVMFRTSAQRLKFVPENGMKVTVRGRIASYVRDGQYQIYCESMEPSGIGALYAAYEQLKNKLAAAGMFDPDHKKALPAFPKKVGIVTSATGAAVRDMLNVIGRRCPMTEILIYPSLVQGDGAVPEIISGIEYFNATKSADVIIIGRGGGSIEDLWAFNDERLALAIFKSEIPIISAVGHETDFTISDFVADLRAPTPSAAAELAVPDVAELKQRIMELYARQVNQLDRKISLQRDRLSRLEGSKVLKDQFAYIDDRNMALARLAERLQRAEEIKLEKCGTAVSAMARTLTGLSPLNVLGRGYSAVYFDKKIVKSTSDVKLGDTVSIRTADGMIGAEVVSITEENK